MKLNEQIEINKKHKVDHFSLLNEKEQEILESKYKIKYEVKELENKL